MCAFRNGPAIPLVSPLFSHPPTRLSFRAVQFAFQFCFFLHPFEFLCPFSPVHHIYTAFELVFFLHLPACERLHGRSRLLTPGQEALRFCTEQRFANFQAPDGGFSPLRQENLLWFPSPYVPQPMRVRTDSRGISSSYLPTQFPSFFTAEALFPACPGSVRNCTRLLLSSRPARKFH